MRDSILSALICAGLFASAVTVLAAAATEILTPAAPATPRITGPNIFGVHPGAPVLYAIPATGRRPLV
jgi:alpha-galactosidase